MAPSQADVEAFVRRVIVDEEPAVALVSDVRELIFEASTYVLAELQKQVSAPAVGEAYRKMPLVPMLQSAKPSSSVSSRKETVKDTHAIQQPAESSRGLPDKKKGRKSKDEQGGPRCWHHCLSHGCKDMSQAPSLHEVPGTGHGAFTCNESARSTLLRDKVARVSLSFPL